MTPRIHAAPSAERHTAAETEPQPVQKPGHHSELTIRLHSQSIYVPNLLAIYKGHSVRRNNDDNIAALRQYLEDWYNEYVPTEKQRSRQSGINLASCAAYLYTHISLDKLKIMSALLAWLFFWDDEIDCGVYTHDHDKTNAYCDDSIAFLRSSLVPETDTRPPAPGRLHNCGTFVEVGKAMSDQSFVDRDRLLQAFTALITTTNHGHAQDMVRLPGVDEYLERRINTIGTTYMCHSMNWAYDLRLPAWIWDHEATNRLIHEVATGAALANDIISLSKEMKDDQVESIIPILVYYLELSAQQAVDEVIAMMTTSYRDFKSAAEELRQAVDNETQPVKNDVETWIMAITDVLVGGVVFQLQSPRYLPRTAFDNDGGFSVVL